MCPTTRRSPPPRSKKTARTFYTDSRVAAARRNIETCPWAAHLARTAYDAAAPYLAMSYSDLFAMVTPQSVPRAKTLHESAGCPVCGDEIHRLGMFPYELDPDGMAWAIRCPLCGSVFPSNDFGSYYRSGLDKRGLFDPSLADRALLENTRYPEKPDDWMVDDGSGAVDTAHPDRVDAAEQRATGTHADDRGIRYMCIAYYNHWAVWGFPMVTRESYGRVLGAAISLRDACLYSGRDEYAEALTLLLCRIATVYPDMNIGAYPWHAGFCNACGNTGKGKVVGRIWECRLARNLVLCYDAVFDALASRRCETALRFLDSRNEISDAQGVIDLIEDALVRSIFSYVESGQIRGNRGMHESTLATAAVVLDDRETATDWLEWLYRPGDEEATRTPRVNGGNLRNVLVDRVDRDGMGDEASPSYNAIWMRGLKVAADALDGSAHPAEYRLYEHPIYRKMFMPYEKLIMMGTYLVSIADSGKCGDPGFGRKGAIEEFFALEAFDRYQAPELARFAELLNRKAGKPLHLDVFSAGQEEIERRLQETLEAGGPYEPESVSMTGYGLAVIRNGFDWDAWMYYGRTFGHGHADSLTIGLHAFGLDLSPDLGNPEHKNRFNRMTHEWFKNTVNHNTVVVDASRQQSVYGGLPKAFYSGRVFGVADVDSPGAYPQTGLYRRGVVTVRVGPTDMYLVDFFRVRGGRSHVLSFHGAEGEAWCEGAAPVAQPTGTYAGPDVPYGHPYDAGGREPHEYEGSGFHYLDRVSRATRPGTPVSVTWKIEDTWGVLDHPEEIYLRFTMLTETDELALADGRPAQNYIGTPERLRYLLARREGVNLESHFVSVVEPYRHAPVVEAIARLDVSWADTNEPIDRSSCSAAGVRVELAHGGVDYILTSSQPDREVSTEGGIRFTGMYAMLRTEHEEITHAVLYGSTHLSFRGNTLLEAKSGFASGVVVDFTRTLSTENEIVVRLDRDAELPLRLPTQVYVENSWERAANRGETAWRTPDGIRDEHAYADVRNGVFEVLGAEPVGDGDGGRSGDRTGDRLVRLDIGDTRLIEYYTESKRHEAGFTYSVAEGDRVRLPHIVEIGGV